MWNASKNTIPREQILQAHLRVLAEAVKDSEMYDIRSSAVYDALDWITRPVTFEGVTVCDIWPETAYCSVFTSSGQMGIV